jgi:hypothetical protein
VFDTYWYLSATPELFVAAAIQSSNSEIASLMNRHERFAELFRPSFCDYVINLLDTKEMFFYHSRWKMPINVVTGQEVKCALA